MNPRKSLPTGCIARSIRRGYPSPTNRIAIGSSSTGGLSFNWCAARRIATPRAVLLARPVSMNSSLDDPRQANPHTIGLMTWIGWALLSALFAAATALLAKVGIAHVDSNLATAIRTTVVLVFAWAITL